MKDLLARPVIVVWFSCGAASAVVAKKTIDRYGHSADIRVVNNPIKEEHHDNRRFLRDIEKWLGVEIEVASNSNFSGSSCVDVWEKRKFMSGPLGAPCTTELKKIARQQWESRNDFDFLVLGFTSEEKKRAERFIMGERSNMIPVLIDENLSKNDCFNILLNAGIKLPEVYNLGYPNANCIGCVKATSPTYWNHVRSMNPEVFEERAKQSREIGARLVRVKNKRIFLDELKPTDTGAPMKSMNIECGIFCEEDRDK